MRLLSILFFGLMLSAPGWCDGYQDGMDAFSAGKYETAHVNWLPLAEAGDALAQFGIGALYDQGKGVKQDFTKATFWFEKAAAQGLAAAQYNLGNAYFYGRGLERSDSKAVRWWLKAAEQGVVNAQFNLGSQYFSGRGVEQDISTAISWYRRAAEGGHLGAQEVLASVGQINAAPVAAETQPKAGSLAGDATQHSAKAFDAAPESHQQVEAIEGLAAEDASQDWLRHQNPEDYSIQLAAMSSTQAVERLIDRYGLKGRLIHFPYRTGERELIVLIQGVYSSYDEGQDALTRYPDAVLRELSPRVRKVSVLQEMASGRTDN